MNITEKLLALCAFIPCVFVGLLMIFLFTNGQGPTSVWGWLFSSLTMGFAMVIGGLAAMGLIEAHRKDLSKK